MKTKPRSSIDGLSHQRRRQTGVQLHNTLIPNQVLRDGERSHLLRLSDQLDTGLDQINGLNLGITGGYISPTQAEAVQAEIQPQMKGCAALIPF